MDYQVEIIEKESRYDGFFQLSAYRLRHSLFSGGWSADIVRERVERLQAASVLLYDPHLDRVVLIEQFRIGAIENGKRAWLYEVVGGLMKEHERPEDVARREAIEEAGCEILDLVPITQFYVSPGTATEQIHLFCGRVDASNAGGVFGIEAEGEDIRAHVIPADEAIAGLDNGTIDSTSVIIALQWLALHREELRQRWCGDGC